MAEGLQPWYAKAIPHEDIRKGRLDESVFAANVWAVREREAPEVYLDPEEFFRKTYMTVGLGTTLKRVAGALSGGEAGDRILSLQTAFGGGKTHTLVALWHLARHADKLRKSAAAAELRDALGDRLPRKPTGVAVFTNQTCDATQGRRTPDGVHTRTLWGEIALQLGGPDLYAKVRANDETQRVPQGLFVEVLRAAAPCLILLDELADYCVGAAAVPVGGTTLADQTISFIQQLTEAVQQVPGAVVVATLPASKFEVAGSEKGQEAFVTLEKRFQRLGADIKPVADDEVYAVVRARLFESIAADSPDYPRKVAEAYRAMYAGHAGEVPPEAAKNAYRDLIERAYPFHPLLIDALHTRWGSHPDLQRTRGVLRLLASVVGDLWARRETNTQSQSLIQPCHIRWSVDAVQAALTRLWGPAYQSVAAADVIGDRSNAGGLDTERGDDYRREAIGQGLAAAILLGSFGGQADRSGFSAKDLKVACARPGLNWSYTDGALLELENRCFYLRTAAAGSLGKRYWFTTKPTLNKLLVQYRQQASGHDYDAEILEAIGEATRSGPLGGATWRVVANPAEDLPEQKTLTLLVLAPTIAWNGDERSQDAVKQRALALSRKCGAKDRNYRNTLLFLAPTSRGLSKLRSAHRERAALAGIQADYASQLDDEQRTDLKKRLDTAERAALETLGPAYTVALRVHDQEVEALQLVDARTNFAEHLAYLWSALVNDEEWILTKIGLVTLKKTGLIVEEGGLRVKDAVEAFLRYTDKPVIATREAVTAGLATACIDGAIGIGHGVNVASLQARYCRQPVDLDPSEDGVWVIPSFERAKPEVKTEASGTRPGEMGETPGGGVTPGDDGGDTAPGGDEERPAARRAVRKIVIRGSVPQESWAELFRCFVGPSARMQLGRLKLGVDFEFEPRGDSPLTADDQSVKAMRESARQLGLEFKLEE